MLASSLAVTGAEPSMAEAFAPTEVHHRLHEQGGDGGKA